VSHPLHVKRQQDGCASCSPCYSATAEHRSPRTATKQASKAGSLSLATSAHHSHSACKPASPGPWDPRPRLLAGIAPSWQHHPNHPHRARRCCRRRRPGAAARRSQRHRQPGAAAGPPGRRPRYHLQRSKGKHKRTGSAEVKPVAQHEQPHQRTHSAVSRQQYCQASPAGSSSAPRRRSVSGLSM
jgi:hypothetical protein